VLRSHLSQKECAQLPLILCLWGPCGSNTASSDAPTPPAPPPYATRMERNSDGGAGEKAALSPDLSERLGRERINPRVKPALDQLESGGRCSSPP